ncbi:CpaF family protein [Paramaledivibacter caminithermalis]|jgi:pilus assembly protein CpaF|uniref:Pilus assembly protein CpaF n=1 Tax=Paramaledivibacter caminithermalis (strain DSM 15212 / CIP 107654 / DViRD3) TaxID=1121301 RepID=A0A1M6PHN9_PARC5|nr:CpaF family protein [Paramaledivibacter caminithermalis]SHK07433.1 pilus assembly protein CpaF [Paramaledivibacter caminithermalis DSM 15212]
MDLIKKEKLIGEIRKLVSDSIDFNKDINDEEIENIITEIVFDKAKEYYLTVSEKQEIIKAIFNSMRRLDILQPLIEDKDITEIMINGPDNIFIEKNGKVSKLELSFQNQERLENVIQSIISKVNRSINESSPTADARLPDGSRVNAVLPPIALNGPILTIRKFPEKPMTIDQLISYKSLNEEAAEVLRRMVEAKYNIFICGGTGSGKTTFLNALSNFIPSDERIITIEDSAELQIVKVPNIVRLETRDANTEGKGEITIRDLIKASLRMRPDRIIVGEVRGHEALDMLQAMNTGHDGSLSTGHANSCEDMMSRLETMVLSAAAMPLDAIRQQIASAIDIIIHLGRLRDKTRRVLEIHEVLGYENGKIQLNPLFNFVEEGETDDKKIIGVLKRTKNKMKNTQKFKMAGICEKV